jgi:hypothetical protein
MAMPSLMMGGGGAPWGPDHRRAGVVCGGGPPPARREQGLRDLVPRRLGPRPGPGGGGGGGAGARHVPGRQTPGSSKVLLHQQGRGLDRETRLTAPPSRRRWRTAKTGTRLHVS